MHKVIPKLMEAHSGFGAPQSQQISLPVKKMQNGIIFVSGRSILLKKRFYIDPFWAVDSTKTQFGQCTLHHSVEISEFHCHLDFMSVGPKDCHFDHNGSSKF